MGAVLPFKRRAFEDQNRRLLRESDDPANNHLGALLRDLTIFASEAGFLFAYEPEKNWIAVYRHQNLSGAWTWIRGYYWWVTPAAEERAWRCQYSWEAASLMATPDLVVHT